MKKVLSLALALAMAVSLVTFSTAGASAASFADSDSIQYGEAVDVISALGIIGGYSDGTFKPTGSLTRGAASKIICNMMLGPEIANQMQNSGTKFSDVPSSHTFSGYIAWCVQQGIVSGYEDGTFKPANTLSVNAFLKMLLCALGYDQNIEGYVGSGWGNNVQIQASKIDLFKGLDSIPGGGSVVTRDVACQLAFNTLQADEVEYTGTTKSSCRTLVWDASVGTKASNISDTTRGGNNIRQFAEDHFDTLVKNANKFSGTDAFARPATSWQYKNSSIGVYPATAAASYAGDVSLGTIYKDLGLTSTASKVALYLNGKVDDSAKITISNGSTTMLSEINGAVGYGTETQAFRDTSSGDITLCTVSYYAGKVGAVHAATATADRYVEIVPSSNDGKSPAGISSHKQFKTTDFEKDDIIAYTYSEKTGESQPIQTVVPLTRAAGTPSRTVAGTSLEMDGKTYYYGKEITFEGTLGGKESGVKTEGDFTLYFLTQDGKNVVLWVEDVKTAAANSYALLTAFEAATSFRSAQARLILADGKENVVTVNSNSDSISPLVSGDNEPILVRYSVNSDGSYTLKRPSGSESASSFNASINNRTAYGLDGTADSTAIPADNNTVFVVQEGKNFKVYNGIRAVPNVTSSESSNVWAYTYYEDGTARVVFLLNGTTSTTSKELMFIAAASASSVVSDSSTTKGYRTFNAIRGSRIEKISVEVGSTMGSLTVASGAFSPKGHDSVLLNTSNLNASGLFISGAYNEGAVTAGKAQGFTTPSGGYLRVGTRDGESTATGTRLALASGVEVYSVSDRGVITETTVTRLSGNDDDWVFYTVADNEITTLIIVKD